MDAKKIKIIKQQARKWALTKKTVLSMLVQQTNDLWSDDINVIEFSMGLYGQINKKGDLRKALQELDDDRLELVLGHAMLGLCTYADNVSTVACACADQEMKDQKVKS